MKAPDSILPIAADGNLFLLRGNALDEAFRKTFFSFLFFFPAGDGATSQETFFARSVSLFLNADSPFATLPPGWLSGEAAGEL